MVDAGTEKVSTEISRNSSASSSKSYPRSERCKQELADYEDEFDVRPPSGTNHQQPGKHLSIDTRFSELGLEESSWVAESERDLPSVRRRGTKISTNKLRHDKVQIPKANFYVTSPFKQGPEKDGKGPVVVVDPSHDLKRRTLAGVAKIKKQLDQQNRSKYSNRPHSHLQRGSLRPLGRPMTASGPPIRNCRGILAGARKHNSFTRREASDIFQYDSSHGQIFRSSSAVMRRPESPTELLRPESSIHNTSCASSVTDLDKDSEGSFSEDESLDSIDDVVDANLKHEFQRPENKDVRFSLGEDVSEPSGQSSSRKREVPNNKSCKPDRGSVERHSDDHDDSDSPEGTWARQSCPPYGRHGNGNRGNGNHGNGTEHKSGSNGGNSSVQTKQRSGKKSHKAAESEDRFSEEENVCNCLNTSSGNKSHVKGYKSHVTRTSEEGNGLLLQAQNGGRQTLIDTSNRCSCENIRKVVKIPTTTSESDNRMITTPREMKESVKDAGENKRPLSCGFTDLASGDFANEDSAHVCDDGGFDSDTLDSDRIASADIFKVLDNLNLSTSAIKPPTPVGERERKRRVQSAGYVRKTMSPLKGAPTRKKSGKRPASAKQGEKGRSAKGTSSDGRSDILENSRTKSLQDLGDSLPGYFTQQYKQLLDEKNGLVKEDESKFKAMTERFRGQERALVSIQDVHGENLNAESRLNGTRASGCERVKSVPLQQFEGDSLSQAELSSKENKRLRRKKHQPSPSSGVFVTVEVKRHLGSTDDAEDSSSGVDTMSYMSDRSNIESKSEMDEHVLYSPQVYSGEVGETVGSDLDNEGQQPDDDGSSLEVIAKPKVLSDARNSKEKKPVAPFLPLSFTINARPPPGSLYYFAYGPDMNANRMAIYLRREPKTRLWGVLFGFRLRFNKKGTSDEAGGFPNVEFSPGNSVEGCVYSLTDTELTMLDNCMGYPKHYTRVVLPVWMLNCSDPSRHGVAQYCVPAVLYVAQDNWVSQDFQPQLNCSYSVNQCLKACDILTPNYVQFLSSQAAN